MRVMDINFRYRCGGRLRPGFRRTLSKSGNTFGLVVVTTRSIAFVYILVPVASFARTGHGRSRRGPCGDRPGARALNPTSTSCTTRPPWCSFATVLVADDHPRALLTIGLGLQ